MSRSVSRLQSMRGFLWGFFGVLLQVLCNGNFIDDRQLEVVIIFANQTKVLKDLGTEYCHLFLSIVCVSCKGEKQEFLLSHIG